MNILRRTIGRPASSGLGHERRI